MSGYQPVDGKTGDRVAVSAPPVLRDYFSGYHPSEGLSSPRLLDPVYPVLLFCGHFFLPGSGGNLPLSAPPLSMETVGSPEGDCLSWQLPREPLVPIVGKHD
jgi:hypothetical protein